MFVFVCVKEARGRVSVITERERERERGQEGGRETHAHAQTRRHTRTRTHENKWQARGSHSKCLKEPAVFSWAPVHFLSQARAHNLMRI